MRPRWKQETSCVTIPGSAYCQNPEYCALRDLEAGRYVADGNVGRLHRPDLGIASLGPHPECAKMLPELAIWQVARETAVAALIAAAGPQVATGSAFPLILTAFRQSVAARNTNRHGNFVLLTPTVAVG